MYRAPVSNAKENAEPQVTFENLPLFETRLVFMECLLRKLPYDSLTGTCHHALIRLPTFTLPQDSQGKPHPPLETLHKHNSIV